MKKLIAAILVSLAIAGALVPVLAETDYPSQPTLRRLMVRIERIAAQLDRLEAAVALIPTES